MRNKSVLVFNASEFLCGNFQTTEIILFGDYNSLIRCVSQLRTTSWEGMSINIMASWINPEGRFKWSLRRELIYIRFTNLQVHSGSKEMVYWY